MSTQWVVGGGQPLVGRQQVVGRVESRAISSPTPPLTYPHPTHSHSPTRAHRLLFDALFYSFLAWFLDQVVPSEFGLQRKPYFLCTLSYWCPSTRLLPQDPSVELSLAAGSAPLVPPPVVSEPEELLVDGGVRIEGLRKTFASGPNNGVAVAGLSLQMRPGQITSLLGANGAGKTTTISMLTGLIPPSAGNAWIGGASIGTSMDAIRTSLGVCPQQNVLFPELSVLQHLTLYGELRGLRGRVLQAAINDVLPRVRRAPPMC